MARRSTLPQRSRSANLLSTVLFIAAIGFAAAAIWVWYTDDSESRPGEPPPAERIEDIDLAHVLSVLKERNDDWTYSRNPATASTDQFNAPGQALQLDDALLFVFIFTGAGAEERIAAREAASERVDLETMTLTTPSGTVINDNGEPLWMAEHSNVMTILVGGDQALANEVAEALTDLP
ncbi:MAG TPA: hypothetical protein VGR22_01265 [Thermomicrobiales bacterium]|nr:hypothetical protein [Thermomicrobiales bacterium]